MSYRFVITSNLLKKSKEITRIYTELQMSILPSKLALMERENFASAFSAFSSTSIEGNPLPLTEVKRILKSRPINLRQSEQEVINYNEAVTWLNQIIKSEGRPANRTSKDGAKASSRAIPKPSFRHNSNVKVFSLKLVLETQALVMRNLIPKMNLGKLRSEPVFVNDPHLRKTIYWPPDHADVPKLLNDLNNFVAQQRSKMDPVLLAGIFHRQFVIIHPFIDGNGRTVRLMTKFLLAHFGINTFQLFSFENYYNNNVSRYFKEVGVIGNYYDLKENIDFTSWLEYFSDGIIDELMRIQKELTNAEIIERTPNQAINAIDKVILEYIDTHGFIRDREYQALTERAKATRSLDFKRLIELGYITKLGRGKNTYYKKT